MSTALKWKQKKSKNGFPKDFHAAKNRQKSLRDKSCYDLFCQISSSGPRVSFHFPTSQQFPTQIVKTISVGMLLALFSVYYILYYKLYCILYIIFYILYLYLYSYLYLYLYLYLY